MSIFTIFKSVVRIGNAIRSGLRGYLLLVPFLVSMAGCQSLLYHPTQRTYFGYSQIPIPPEDIYFESDDGTKLHAWHFKNRVSKKPKAVFTHFHGNAENVSSHFMALFWTLEDGYDTIIFDYRGYGLSEGKPTTEGTVRDGYAALRLTRKLYPDTPLVVFGQSLGGAIALRAIADIKDEIKPAAVVVDSTFPSYEAAARTVLANLWLTWPLCWMANPLLDDTWAPEDKIASIAPTPLLVMHGDADPIVGFWLGERVFALAGEPKEFVRVEGGRHTDAFFRDSGRYRKDFLRFVEKHTDRSKDQ